MERRAVHERTIAEAVHNFGLTGNQLVRPALEEPGVVGEATRREVADIIEATKVREFKTLGIVLGMRYENSPIWSPIAAAASGSFYALCSIGASGLFGSSLWLYDGSSLYDHFGEGFTVTGHRGRCESN